MEKRVNHLNALCRDYVYVGASNRHAHKAVGINIAQYFVNMVAEGDRFETLFNFLVTEIDGFGDDPFLKRAILFFLEINRLLGWYEDDLEGFPVPADYQVPKMLRHHRILEYGKWIDSIVNSGGLIQENGPIELSIRAATILAAEELSNILGWSTAEVDSWFFSQRKETKRPFHLCITSNY
jgi:hypothetical protein